MREQIFMAETVTFKNIFRKIKTKNLIQMQEVCEMPTSSIKAIFLSLHFFLL